MMKKQNDSALQIQFTPQQEKDLQAQISEVVAEKIDQITDLSTKPYLKLKEFCSWTGLTSPTIRKLVKAGLPVAEVNGLKLYGKDTYVKWLRSQEN